MEKQILNKKIGQLLTNEKNINIAKILSQTTKELTKNSNSAYNDTNTFLET